MADLSNHPKNGVIFVAKLYMLPKERGGGDTAPITYNFTLGMLNFL